jgi:RHS repeat-associated protein
MKFIRRVDRERRAQAISRHVRRGRLSTSVGCRVYIGQFADTEDSLSYLNARHFDANRGQFLSEDPVHLAIGSAARIKNLTGQELQTYLRDPQSLNSYSYAKGNPITLKDPQGLTSLMDLYQGRASLNDYYVDVGQGAMILSQESPTWNYALQHPYRAGAVVGGLSVVGAESAVSATVALGAATYPGVGAAYAAQQTFAAAYYSALTLSSLGAIPGAINTAAALNFSQPSTALSSTFSLSLQIGPTLVGGYIGALSDITQFLGLLDQGLTTLRSKGAGAPSNGNNTRPSAAPPKATKDAQKAKKPSK